MSSLVLVSFHNALLKADTAYFSRESFFFFIFGTNRLFFDSYFVSSLLLLKTGLLFSFFLSSLRFQLLLEQLLCREPVSACIIRKKLHSGRYLRSFKNTQGQKLQFVDLYISDNKPFRDHFLEVFSKFQKTLKKFGYEFVSSSVANSVL